MDIIRLALLHDLALLEFYSRAIWCNVMEIEVAKGNVYEKIFELN